MMVLCVLTVMSEATPVVSLLTYQLLKQAVDPALRPPTLSLLLTVYSRRHGRTAGLRTSVLATPQLPLNALQL